MDKIKSILVQIFATNIGWLIISLLMILVFIILSDKYAWADTAIYICLIYPIGYTLTVCIYAWIINPIRNRKQNKNLNDGNK